MAKGKENYVSFWFWFFALALMAIPCLGFVLTIVWAFAGENESRKNYFRALLAWMFIGLFLWLGLMALGLSPLLKDLFERSIKYWPRFLTGE